MTDEKIIIRGAREHNLKNVNLELPRNRLIVITGLSGSGKSSLAFDTLYAEGQRRYVESLSAYARQFLGQMEKPDVDDIQGLSPAISIDQKGISKNPRSTVATVTEIYDYLRLLFARIGIPHCPQCGEIIEIQTIQQMVDRVLAFPQGEKISIYAPLVRGRKGEYRQLLEQAQKDGFLRVRVDGTLYELGEAIPLEKNKKHTIEVVVDRITLDASMKGRIAESLEVAVHLSGGLVLLETGSGEALLSEKFTCARCNLSLEEIAPRSFSFNSPYGACQTCTGLGVTMDMDPDLLVPNEALSLMEGGVVPLGRPVHDYGHHAAETYYWRELQKAARYAGIDLYKPIKFLSSEEREFLFYGTDPASGVRGASPQKRAGREAPSFPGIIPILKKRYEETESWRVKWEMDRYMTYLPCPACQGARLKKSSLAVTLKGRNIARVTQMSVFEALGFFEALDLTPREQMIAHQVLKEIRNRLHFLLNVGLDYLTLDRAASTLAGGEAQRIRLATQIGSSLVGVLYILDEPSIGLHQRDNRRLLKTLQDLRDLGNTLIVVEHDEETIRAADHVVDIGPGAGIHGGEVLVSGTLQDLLRSPDSLTGKYLRHDLSIPVPEARRDPKAFLEVVGARENNLKNLSVMIPLGIFVSVTGVSGSGKSSLVNDVLYKAIAQKLQGSLEKPGDHDEVRGLEHLDKVVIIDQSPIGRTPRSNPTTYTGAFDPIREIYSLTRESRIRGYKPGRFSFNLRGGRCEACQGDGIITIEMHFLPDVYVPCEVCKGKRYNRETLEVAFKGKNISEVLEMTVEEALEFFYNIPKIQRKLQTLYDVGLGYIHLGQPATTLSGGEAQRVKLATELSRRATGRTLYILDEPTTGLHFDDVAKLLMVLDRLVQGGNSVLVIEHNLEVIKQADWIIDLGPEGGDKGGEVVVSGPPELVAQAKASYTGQFLKKILKGVPVYS